MPIVNSSIAMLLLAAVVVVVVWAPIVVSAECTCDANNGEGKNKAEALKFKIVAIASILMASAIGVCLPILSRFISALKPEKDIFFVIKAFAAGVILATGFVHVLPDAYEHLTSPCLKGAAWEFPWAGTVAMVAAIGMLMIDTQATSYFHAKQEGGNKGDNNGEEELPVHTHATHGHSHGTGVGLSATDNNNSLDLIRHRVISQVLELGIVVHSVVIGISLGASQSPTTIRPLVAALTFHQFFEGMGLGGCITQAKFKNRAIAIMVIFFSLTTPIGIAIGIGIMNVYDENSQTALIVEGFLNSASAGILIYMALVDLLAADFMNPRMHTNRKLQTGAHVALLLGAGCMSLLAIWA